MARSGTTVPQEIKIARINNEWSMSWNHIGNISTVFWGIFAAQVVINGAIVFKFDDLNATAASFWLLLFNILVALHYQREHWARMRIINHICGLRKALKLPDDEEKLLFFNSLRVPKPRFDKVHAYFISLHLLFIAIPFYLFCCETVATGKMVYSCANLASPKGLTAFAIFVGAAIWYGYDDAKSRDNIAKHWKERKEG